jgi:hypothetical protein
MRPRNHRERAPNVPYFRCFHKKPKIPTPKTGVALNSHAPIILARKEFPRPTYPGELYFGAQRIPPGESGELYAGSPRGVRNGQDFPTAIRKFRPIGMFRNGDLPNHGSPGGAVDTFGMPTHRTHLHMSLGTQGRETTANAPRTPLIFAVFTKNQRYRPQKPALL